MVKEMIGYVTGQRSYGFMTYDKGIESYKWGREENWKSAKEKASKRVKCLNDGLEFSSITEASKFYFMRFPKSQQTQGNLQIGRSDENSFSTGIKLTIEMDDYVNLLGNVEE